ncbi:MAG: hypothetical protein EXQ54_06265 [Acidobacteria bacterium]|nr:hypothetical protein [Acidobacteriota bacterium]
MSAVLGYRALADEQALTSARHDGAGIDQAAEEALAALLDVRGSMYAYVAPNQGTEFWGRRVSTLLDTLRQRLVTLDAAVAASGGSLAESLDGIDQLAAADKRARQYADRNELLLAGDVLFVEVRDLLNTVTEQVARARQTLRNEAERKAAGIRQEQAALATAAVAVWFVAALLLMPGTVKPVAKEPGEWRQELADTLKKSVAAEDLNLDIKKVDPLEIPAPPIAVAAPHVDLKAVAEICADLAALADIGALSGALARASDVLGAKGLIVWVTAHDGGSLSPVSTHGFDARVVERIGAIDRASANLTAEAFRENAPRVSAATASSGGALAVPMRGPTGVVGVLSAELQPGKDADEACVAVASILAAQLATLTAPLPMPASVERDAESAAS